MILGNLAFEKHEQKRMKNESIVAARKAAELAVEGMSNGPLKIAAFQTILAQLLQREVSSSQLEGRESEAAKKKAVGPRVQGTTGRLMTLIEDGVFKQQRSLAEIRNILSEKGWYYQLEDLGTPVTRLVRRKYLRRTQVAEGGKRIWKYSDY
ncbi:MAG TPA: hypothetical protein VN176_17680 [Verrucomicrobiae bacterium]|nr:hypothetical protein [Verrucomicrobiae bacterium]